MIRILSLIVFVFLGIVPICYCQDSSVDSIVQVITSAKEGAKMESIQADVGPGVLAFNRWANDALWNEPDQVKEVAEIVIDFASLDHNDSLLSWAYHYLAMSYYNMNYWNQSIDIYDKALSTDWAMNSSNAASFRAFSTLNIGCNYELLGAYDKAADYYYRSIRMNEDLGVPYVAAEAKLDVASLNIRIGRLEPARNDIVEAIPVLQQFNDSARVSDGLRLLSLIAVAEGSFEEAKGYIEEALKINQLRKDWDKLCKIYLDYGDALFRQLDIPGAHQAYNQAFAYCSEEKFPASYYQVCSKLGRIYIETNQFNQAADKLLAAHEGLVALNASTLLLDVEKNLASLYAKTGDYKSFQRYFDMADSRKDSLVHEEQLRSIGESEVIYKTAHKDRQLAIQRIRISNREKQIFLVSAIAMILFLGLVLVLRLLRNVETKNRGLLERNLELSRQWDQIQGSYFSNDTLDGDSMLFKEIYDLVAEKEEYTNPKLTVDFLARELNSNTKYISNAIKERTGMNFNGFVNAFRIEKAKTLLRNGASLNWSLEVIAEHCGFNNHTTFYQSFRKNTGLTPSAYRRIR